MKDEVDERGNYKFIRVGATYYFFELDYCHEDFIYAVKGSVYSCNSIVDAKTSMKPEPLIQRFPREQVVYLEISIISIERLIKIYPLP